MAEIPAFIGVDWGTSNSRFTLASASGAQLKERAGPGIAALAGPDQMEAACFAAISDWPHLPIVISGMAGADIGWHPAPYVRVPATAAAIHGACVRFTVRGVPVALLPGISAARSDGYADFMRGEEVQIFGAQDSASGLLCLPGTHTKWAQVNQGKITHFHTAMSGELMEAVGRGTILLNPARAPVARPGAQFLEGVNAIIQSRLGLETMLFTVRSRQLSGTLAPEAAEDYLAGLCIGSDIGSAQALYADLQSVTLIGVPQLTALYAAALASIGLGARQIDGKTAALAGLTGAYQAIFG